MKDQLCPLVVFRRFRNRGNDVVEDEGGVYRLASSLFRGTNISVDDGALSTASQAAAREADCGVAAIPKATIAAARLSLLSKPLAATDPGGPNPAHCEIDGKARPPQAKQLRKAAKVVVQIPSGPNVEDGEDARWPCPTNEESASKS